MLTKTQEKLIEILRSELTGTDEADLSGLSDQELAAIYRLAKAHNLSSMAGDYMSRHGVMNKVILRDMAYAQSNVEHMDKAMTEITKALSEAVIPFLPLKGIVIRKLYPRPWMRLSGDIDILIHKEDKDTFIKVLRDTLSYTYEPGTSGDHFITSDGVLLDISTALHGPESIDQNGALYSDIWDYAVPEKAGSVLYILSDAMCYTHAVIHIAKHLRRGGCGISHLMNLWTLNHLTDTDNTTKTTRKRLDLLKKKHVETLEAELLKISEKWFSGTDCETNDDLENYILNGSAHGTTKSRAISDISSMGAKTNLQYYLKRLFVPYDYLQKLFPQIKGKRWLVPFYEVYRWIYHVKNGRTASVRKEFLAVSQQNKQEVEEANFLLDNLGI